MIPLTEQDAEHLGLLVVFHYLVGAVGVIFHIAVRGVPRQLTHISRRLNLVPPQRAS